MSATLLLSSHSISKCYGTHTLFIDISLSLFSDERMGLIGPNGSGKSTLLKILAGAESPDSGKVVRKREVLAAYIPQEEQFDLQKTVADILFQSVSGESLEPEHYQRVRALTQQVAFPNLEQKVGTLSGGWRKRLAIGRALIQQPDLLLIDEPTNHLDMEGILWLEDLLRGAPFAFVVVSHDRYFLENTTTRIVELNRKYPEGFLKVEGNYSEFLRRREAILSQQLQQEAALATKVRRELEWLQRGPKARTTKARYRLEGAQQLQYQLKTVKARNAHGKTAAIDFEATHRQTKKLLEARNIGIKRGGKLLFSYLNLVLSPGECIGVLGQNGSGKSTLMHLLKGDLQPASGVIKRAERVQVVAFDQSREQLNRDQTLKQALCPLGDQVIFRGEALHVTAWAKRFLFPKEKLELPVSQLSGGEQSRVLIANLMLQPADILLLDEPTNDLDIPTLEVLEESLQDFPGALVLVTHDRFLMNCLSDRVLYLDGEGRAEFFADYEQWLEIHKSRTAEASSSHEVIQPQKKPIQGLSHGERKELNRIEQKIAKAEAAVAILQQQLYDPEIMSDAECLADLHAQLQKAENKVEQLYQRWEELEALNQSS